MTSNSFTMIALRRAVLIPLSLSVSALLALHTVATPVAVDLGTASDFAVLAGSGITVAGAVNTTIITGDIGTHPTPSITGLQNVVLNGANHADDAVTQNAKNNLVVAYNDAAIRPADVTYAGGFDLVGLTLFSGVYRDASSLFLSGTLTLDAQGNPDAVFIFQIGSTLITVSDSKVALIGGAQACHVFWQVGSSATLGTDTDFMGNILALTSITLNTGAEIEGRLLARNGAVTLDQNIITLAICDDAGGSGGTSVPDGGGTFPYLAAGLLPLICLRKTLLLRIK